MVRPQKECRIEQIPPYEKYKPAGIPMREIDLVILTMEEAEAIRLADMEELDQAAAAEQMVFSGRACLYDHDGRDRIHYAHRAGGNAGLLPAGQALAHAGLCQRVGGFAGRPGIHGQ